MSATSFFRKFHLAHMAAVLRETARRFPLPLLFVTLLTALILGENHDLKLIEKIGDDLLARACLFLGQGAVLALGLRLFAEGRGLRRLPAFLLSGAALAALAATVFVPDHAAAGHVFVTAAVALLLLFAPFLRRAVGEDAVWGFNYLSALAVVFGGVSALVLCGGLSAILSSVEYLFEVDVHHRVYADIWIAGGFFFFPAYVLAGVPRDFDRAGESCGVPGGVHFIANYLMVPMMLAYAAILYAYGAKIVLQWSLPRGNLAYMVTGFGGIGVLTHLAVYPMRETGTRLLRFFYRHFYLVLTGPLALLAVGIWTRIRDYGVTEPRYAIVLCLVWLAFLSLLHIFRRGALHIKHVPMALAVLALLAAFGPWSATQVSLDSQHRRLEAALRDAGVLQDDGAVQRTARAVGFETRKNISSLLEYFKSRRQLDRLRAWIEPVRDGLGEGYVDKDIYACSRRAFGGCHADYDLPKSIMSAWGMDYVSRWTRTEDDGRISVGLPHSLRGDTGVTAIGGYDYRLQLWAHRRGEEERQQSFHLSRRLPGGGQGEDAALRRLDVSLQPDAKLLVAADSGGQAVFDLQPLIDWSRQANRRNLTAEHAPMMTLAPVAGDMRAVLQLSEFAYDLKAQEEGADGAPSLQSLHGVLLFSLPQAADE